MTQNQPTLILKQPLWKKGWLILISLVFVIVGASLISAGEYLIGILSVVFFGAGGAFIIFKSSTALIADSEGIIPTYALPRNSSKNKKIPWAMIEKIGVATQKMRSVGLMVPTTSTLKFLAIYLHDKEFFTAEKPITSAISQEIVQNMKQSGFVDADDGMSAQVYIPESALPGWSLQKVVDQLNAMRPV